MEKIGIIGYGIVGKACDYGFNVDGNQILAYDKFKPIDTKNKSPNGRSTPLLPLEEVVDRSEFLFVCLPTPFHTNPLLIDLSIMDENIGRIARMTDNTNKVVIVKSTVVPGTTRGYSQQYPTTKFCFNPEFLTEKNYLEDFVNAKQVVIGADNNRTSLRVNDLYRTRFPKMHFELTDPSTAEMVKYTTNIYLAMKVAFANQMDIGCRAIGIKWPEVKRIVVNDDRIEDTHLDVTSDGGFGGKCFPKDLAAMLGLFNGKGVDTTLLQAVWDFNLKVRKVRDWEDIPFAMSDPNRL